MARLPAETPVVMEETVRVDPRLQLDTTPNRTRAMAEAVPLSDPTNIIAVDDGGQICEHVAVGPTVQLSAVIVAQEAPGVPDVTVPFPAYERAVEALGDGELTVELDSQTELLNWMANTLTALGEPPDIDRDEFDEEGVDTIPNLIDDVDLRAALAVESDRVRQAAARLDALRARIADHEAVADLTDAAEEITRIAAGYPDPDEEP